MLSILICSLEERATQLASLLEWLGHHPDVEVLTEIDNRQRTTGTKRNQLLKRASGEYVVFIDDDDNVTSAYIPQILKALESNPDAVGFKGWMTTNDSQFTKWEISKDHKYETVIRKKKKVYLRYNNHISPVRRSIALQIGFPDLTYGEDYDFAKRLHESGLIQTEVFIDEYLYHYNYKQK